MKNSKHRPRKYICTYENCCKAYSRPSLLEQHRRTHVNERPFQCDLCGKRFFRTSHLKSHKWTHSDEKPLNCSFCPKGFVTGQQLSRHINTHHASEVEKNRKGTKIITRAATPPSVTQGSNLQNDMMNNVSMTPIYPMVTNQLPTPAHFYQESPALQVSNYNYQLQPPAQIQSIANPPLQPVTQQQIQQPYITQAPQLHQQSQPQQGQGQGQQPYVTPVSQVPPPRFSPQSQQVPQFSPQGIPAHQMGLQPMNPYLRYETAITSTSSPQPFLIMCPYECGLSFPEGKELNDHMSEHQIMLDIGTYATKMDNQSYNSYEWAGNPFCREYSEQPVIFGT